MAKKKRGKYSFLANQKLRLVILLILIFILGMSLTLSAYFMYMVEDTKTIPYEFIVDEYVGLKADNDAFYFGAVQPTGNSKREFYVSSEQEVNVFISATGDGAEWISVSENAFLLAADEPKQLFLYVGIPADAEFKEYEGQISLLFLRPNLFFSPRENLLAVADESQ
jgi:hypothetical protein